MRSLRHLGLRPDHHVLAGELLHVDAHAAPVEAQLEAVVRHAELVHPRVGADLAQRLDGAVLEDAGALAGLDALARAGLEHHRVHTAQPQQVREHQPGGPAADDRDLGAVRGAHAGVSVVAAGGWASP